MGCLTALCNEPQPDRGSSNAYMSQAWASLPIFAASLCTVAVSSNHSHVGIAVCGPRGTVYHKQLLQGELQGPRQLLNLVPARSTPGIMVLSAAQQP